MSTLTLEEANTLPVGSVVKDRDHDTWTKDAEKGWHWDQCEGYDHYYGCDVFCVNDPENYLPLTLVSTPRDEAMAAHPAGGGGADAHDVVTRPSHYTEGRSIEPLDAIEDWGLNFHRAQVVKYISRAGRKGDELEDLRKAAFYLTREIERMEAGR